ncbi:hypothetical protein [Verrucomicrobium spinosum]|nr:hypothetical protein [Verrucomicrobium spinosum]
MKLLLAPFYAVARAAAAVVDLLASGTTHIKRDIKSITLSKHKP